MPRLLTTDLGLALLDSDSEHLTLLDLAVPDLGTALGSGLSVTDLTAALAKRRLPLSQVQLQPPVPTRPKSGRWALPTPRTSAKWAATRTRNRTFF
jgi:hypothetical protein